MNLEFLAKSNIISTVKLFLNDHEIWSHDGDNFFANIEFNHNERNMLDISWHSENTVDVNLIVSHILINNQKLDINKSMYLPFDKPSGYSDYYTLHGGNLVWPGILRTYFKIMKSQNYVQNKEQDSNMIRKYNIIYD